MGRSSATESPDSVTATVSPVKASLTLAALGVVFGDIGTSPLYALRECFTEVNGLGVTRSSVLGSVSLIIWFLIVIVSIKYVIFVMRADNKGEGGIMALMALVHRIGSKKIHNLSVLTFAGILGAALLFGNGVITPAISVLSAIEGVSVVAPLLSHLIIPIALVVLTGLFLIQYHGTAKIGMIFGPVMLLWFITIGLLGVRALFSCPDMLHALNPVYAFSIVKTLGIKSLILISAAFLALTGAEVLYADMGHFGKTPIRIAWFYCVFPGLVLNYLGQGAQLLVRGELPGNLFYSLTPAPLLIPMIILATLATIIASQAVISGAFSLFRQSVQLGFWPRIQILHTSKSNIGQVYIPFVNFLLCVVTFLLIAGFKKSGNMASAYGITVAATMLITTFMIILIARSLWKIPLLLLIPVSAIFLSLDIALFIANLSKFASGGWIIVAISASLILLMTTWIAGRNILQQNVRTQLIPLEDFVNQVKSQDILRTARTAIFLSGNAMYTPRALLHNFKHNGVMHAVNLVVGVLTEEIPHVKKSDRYIIKDMGNGIYAVTLRYGFMESPDLPAAIAKLPLPVKIDLHQCSYFLGKESLLLKKKGKMPLWRKQLFIFMSKNSLGASSYFKLPPNSVVELGAQVEF